MKILNLKKTKLKQLNTKTMLQARETAMIGAGTMSKNLKAGQKENPQVTEVSCIRDCPVTN